MQWMSKNGYILTVLVYSQQENMMTLCRITGTLILHAVIVPYSLESTAIIILEALHNQRTVSDLLARNVCTIYHQKLTLTIVSVFLRKVYILYSSIIVRS